GSALDVARVGQMLANAGGDGGRRFFSEKTFERLLPIRLAAKYPQLDDPALEWGIGLSCMFDPPGYLRLNPRLRQVDTSGPNVIGHSSMSSSLFRVDLDIGLVVVMGREATGERKNYQEYRAK